ncbi:hypothetical protein Pint_04543 [Pistacia integerrima]|uniref:Uncharacterized protein n=1 Tax=Pistacia integerrima TaxID=434235 RepID=A0ACC0Z9T3_9ROSI|nr:hypothetical protein Pint_04543 [Pistacia integerrima]
MEQQSENILYETLSPLPLSTLSDVPSRPQSPPLDQLEPYTVFRNEISLSDLGGGYVESPAPDFFSLDVNSSGVDELEEAEPKWQKEPKTPTRELEPRLESGWFRGNSSFKSPMLQLHKEIVDFCDFLSPTPEEQALRNSAVESVFDVIKYIWPKCKVSSDTSSFYLCVLWTGLYLPTSDIDVVILGSGIRNPPTGLQALSRALSQRGIAKKIQPALHLFIFVFLGVLTNVFFPLDDSFDAQNGPKAAEFIKVFILPVFLVYSGGIGSYALLTMLMALLKHYVFYLIVVYIISMVQSLYECQTSPEHNLGVLLVRVLSLVDPVHFFDIYGRKLNTTDVGVSCKGKGTFFKKSSKGFTNKGRPFLISIEDPQAPENDIGKNSFNYFQVCSTI